MFTITHTAAEGTLIEGTSKGDGSNQILKAAGWRWSPTVRAWYVPRSRDTAPKTHIIADTANRLRGCGHEVTISIDATPRPTAQVQTAAAARSEERAARLNERAATKSTEADSYDTRAAAMRERIPAGQPILVGHHSEGRDRRFRNKIHAIDGKAADARSAAEQAQERATAAAAHTGAKTNPVTLANRIERLKADERATERAIDRCGPTAAEHRENMTARLAALTEQRVYWEQVQADQFATGQVIQYTRDNVAKGDLVKIRGRWYTVTRANPKTVTVPSPWGVGTDTAPYAEIQERRSA